MKALLTFSDVCSPEKGEYQSYHRHALRASMFCEPCQRHRTIGKQNAGLGPGVVHDLLEAAR